MEGAFFPDIRPPLEDSSPGQHTFVGHDDTGAFRVGDPGQSEGWGLTTTLYAWLNGVALAVGMVALVLGIILFRAWQNGELGTGGGSTFIGNCSLSGDANGNCLSNTLSLVNLATPGTCGVDDVLVHGDYDTKGRTLGGACVPRDPPINVADIVCGSDEILTGPFTLLRSGRTLQLGAICVPRLEQVRNTTLACALPGQVLGSPFTFDIYGRMTGGACVTPAGNGSLPNINNGSHTCPAGSFITGTNVTGEGLVVGPFFCLTNGSTLAPINAGDLACPAGYFLNFTLLQNGLGFLGSCVELRLSGEVQGSNNNTQITAVRSAVTCATLEALSGATYLASGQAVGGSCVSFVSNNTLPVINNATNCTADGAYSLSKITTNTGLQVGPVCVQVVPGQLNANNATCGPGYYTNLTILQDGRSIFISCIELVAQGAVTGPLNNTALAVVTTSAVCAPGEALSGATRQTNGLTIGGSCVSFVSNNTLPVINNSTNCSNVGEYALSKVVTNTGLSFQPQCILVTPQNLNPTNVSCNPGYFMQFTLFRDGRGFNGTCVELRAFGDIQGPLNATTITPVTTLLTCNATGVMLGQTRRATGQISTGSCLDLPTSNATNCTGVDEYALSKTISANGFAINAVCKNVTTSSGGITSLTPTTNQTTTTNLGGMIFLFIFLKLSAPQAAPGRLARSRTMIRKPIFASANLELAPIPRLRRKGLPVG